MDKQQLPQEWQEQIIQESKVNAIDGSSNNLYYIEGAVTWSKRAYEAEKRADKLEKEMDDKLHQLANRSQEAVSQLAEANLKEYAALKAQADKMAEVLLKFRVLRGFWFPYGEVKPEHENEAVALKHLSDELDTLIADYQGKKEGL